MQLTLLGVSSDFVLAYWQNLRLGLLASSGIAVSCCPNKVLEQFTVVLLVDHHASAKRGGCQGNTILSRQINLRLQDIPDIFHQELSVR